MLVFLIEGPQSMKSFYILLYVFALGQHRFGVILFHHLAVYSFLYYWNLRKYFFLHGKTLNVFNTKYVLFLFQIVMRRSSADDAFASFFIGSWNSSQSTRSSPSSCPEMTGGGTSSR
jgi:hypothetical protein